MGDRGNVVIKYFDGNKIFFYSHWGGSGLKETVRQALKRGQGRWNDESYLARIVFSEMTKDEAMELTGYGISPYEIDNENPLVTVDTKAQTVNGIPFEDYIKNPIQQEEY